MNLGIIQPACTHKGTLAILHAIWGLCLLSFLTDDCTEAADRQTAVEEHTAIWNMHGVGFFQRHLCNNTPVTKAGDWKWSGYAQTDGLRQ